MANSKLNQPSSFASKHKGSNGGVAKPRFRGPGEAPTGNAANSANPPGSLSVLKKVSKQGTFRSSKS